MIDPRDVAEDVSDRLGDRGPGALGLVPDGARQAGTGQVAEVSRQGAE